MGSLSTGGGSSAVAASAHAGCERFRHTDPMVTGLARRELAERLGHADADGGIPEARWMRAMTFERLVKDERFVAPLLTTAVGDLRLRRPDAVTRLDARVSVGATAQALAQAHEAAVEHGHCTLITSLALPFVGLEGETGATPLSPTSPSSHRDSPTTRSGRALRFPTNSTKPSRRPTRTTRR